MKLLSFPKTWRFLPAAERSGKTSAGSTALMSVFLFLIFSTLGLGMLYLTQIYLKWSGCKKDTMRLEYAAENGIKQGFDQLLHLLSLSSSPLVVTPGELKELREKTLHNSPEILERLLGCETPLRRFQKWGSLEWENLTEFILEKFKAHEFCFQTVFRVMMTSAGRAERLRQKKESVLESQIGIFAGHIPLPAIPFLIEKTFDDGQRPFQEKNKITLIPTAGNFLRPPVSFSEEPLIPREADSLLAKALRIGFFDPKRLSRPLLRRVLGLNETNEPVPEGIYLIQDDTGLGGVYIQGDVEEMVTAVEEDFQIVSFLTDSGRWTLRFSPQRSQTFFATPDEVQHFDLTPVGIIIANGKIRSLGGGVSDLSGRIEMVRDKEIPSILQGVSMTIISPQRITLSSHLIQQGFQWMERVPYVKGAKPPLVIFATGKDFQGDTKREGEIIIDGNAPAEIRLQASLTAAGKGFSIEGKNKKVHLLGSLQVSDYSSGGNALELFFDDSILESNFLGFDAPRTAKPVLWLSFFKPVAWKEF